MTGIFLSYIGALLICVASVIGGLFLLKKKGIKFYTSFFFVGIISAIAVAVSIILMFRVIFSGNDYYNTVFFRTMVGGIVMMLLCALRFLLVKSVFFNRYREEQGYSFGLGFGLAPGLFLGVYVLIMIVMLAGNCLFNGPCIIEAEYLSFADNTVISIFQPPVGHISFALLFAFYALIVCTSSLWADKLNGARYHPVIVITWTILLALLEGVSLLLLPFMKMYGLSHWKLTLCVGACAVFSAVLVHFAPVEKEKDSTYIKQFE